MWQIAKQGGWRLANGGNDDEIDTVFSFCFHVMLRARWGGLGQIVECGR